MSNNLIWQLPLMFRTEKVLSRISWDGQVYFACQQCFWEERVDPTFASGLEKTFNNAICKQCGARGIHLIRHLEHREYRCEDCDESFQVETTGFETIRCPHCMSMHLLLLSNRIVPPFPPRFGPGIVAKSHPWGESVVEDYQSIAEEIQWMNTQADFPFHLLWSIRFCRRLRLYGGYEDREDRAAMFNIEGNFLRDYFRLTGEIPAGLEALTLFEESVRLTDEPIQRAANEHNVAMAIYSLLSRYPEGEISFLTGRSNLRMEGIAAAERALSVFEREPDTHSFGIHCARVHHLLGDLLSLRKTDYTRLEDLFLSLGKTDYAQLKQAVDHYNRALDSGTLSGRAAIGVRDSRATAILEMTNPPSALRSQAIEDLEQVILWDESERAWQEKWRPLFNLATLYIEEDKLLKALPLLERAAALALTEIAIVGEETILQQKGQRYYKLFAELSYVYIKMNKAKEALNAVETLRAASLHLHTMSNIDKVKFDVHRAKRMISTLIPGAKPSHAKVGKLRLASVDPHIEKLARYVKDDVQTAFITLSILYDDRDQEAIVTAVVVAAKEGSKYRIRALEWKTGAKARELLLAYRDVDYPSPLRETRLQRMCQLGYEVLFAPLMPLLREWDIRRVAISAPGGFSYLPFEAFSPADASAGFLIDQFEVFYLPSLTLGGDLVRSSVQRGKGRLLVVGYQGDDLPYTRNEIQALKDLWKDQMTLLEGDACTKRRVLNELAADYDYIHFICHGTFDMLNHLDSALHLVPQADRDSQRVTARDILELRFQHMPVITLSACSSALASFNGINDYTGLTGSFLRSGARCVIGSRWPVYDDVGALFMSQLYGKIQGADVSPQHCVYEVQHQMAKSVGIEDWAAFGYLGLP